MSGASIRAAQARDETCQNCKRWHKYKFDSDGEIGRCGKFTQRVVITLNHETCKNFRKQKVAE